MSRTSDFWTSDNGDQIPFDLLEKINFKLEFIVQVMRLKVNSKRNSIKVKNKQTNISIQLVVEKFKGDCKTLIKNLYIDI